MAADNARGRFLGGAPADRAGTPAADHGLVRRSIPPAADTPVKPDADARRGPGVNGVRHVKSTG